MQTTEVFIAGAGPTGLVLALWLTHQGVKVRIIDKTAQPGTTSRAMVVHARTLEFYAQAGIADAVAAAGMKNPAINMWVSGRRRARISLGNAGKKVTPYPYVLIYPQDHHERFLIDALREQGVTVERETELIGFVDHGDRVVVRTRSASGIDEESEALYLAGCDGARSTVRHQLAAGFEGGTYQHLFYVADVLVKGMQPPGELHVSLQASDFVLLMSYNTLGHARLIGTVRDEHPDADPAAHPLTFEDASRDALQSLGVQVDAVNWFSTYRVHHRVTDRYREGRVFLLGDAAHVHSPVGGQGMNTGIGDAINLAWKLRAVIRANAPDALLDSYQAERKAFAEQLVATTDRMFTLVTAGSTFANFIKHYVAPLVMATAGRVSAVREQMFRLVSQTRISYRGGPLAEGSAGSIEGGDRLPWVRVGDGDNFTPFQSMQWQVHIYGTAQPALIAWCKNKQLALHEFSWNDECAASGLVKDALYLVRPDTYVALVDATGQPEVVDAYCASHGLQFQ